MIFCPCVVVQLMPPRETFGAAIELAREGLDTYVSDFVLLKY